MHVDNGRVGTQEEMDKKYGQNNPRVVPVPSKEVATLRQWGRKKRERYAELIKEGASNDQAFDTVENYKGIIPDKYLGKIELADDFKMTTKNPLTGEEKVLEKGKDYSVSKRF